MLYYGPIKITCLEMEGNDIQRNFKIRIANEKNDEKKTNKQKITCLEAEERNKTI